MRIFWGVRAQGWLQEVGRVEQGFGGVGMDIGDSVLASFRVQDVRKPGENSVV